MSRVLVVTLDTLTARMAGPAIRAWEISRLLGSLGHQVRLVTFAACEREGEGFTAATTSVDAFRSEVEGADIVIIQGYIAATFPWLAEVDQYLVFDLYDPFHLESLAVERLKPAAERTASIGRALRELEAEARWGDFFLCASEKQRDLWLGHLGALGRLNPSTYDEDPSLRRLLDVAPFGMAVADPAPTASGIRGVVPGIGEDDTIVLWGGGVYNWFDPLTVIEAVDKAREEVPNLRLVFLGMKHPNPDVPEMAMAMSARDLAGELGLTGTHVFFHEGWVPYDERVNFLCDADLGISAHFDDVETAFSFRTRILDYLWTGLPIVCSEGDTFGNLVEERALGAAVPVEDAEAMTAAIVRILTDDVERESIRARVRETANDYRWPTALAALTRYCEDPWYAADKGEQHDILAARKPLLAQLRDDVRGTFRAIRNGGIGEVVRKVRWRLRRGR